MILLLTQNFFSPFNPSTWDKHGTKLNKILPFLSADPTFCFAEASFISSASFAKLIVMSNFCSPSSSFIFLSSLNLDYVMTNYFFPLYTRVSKSIIHSNKQSMFYTFKMPTLNGDLSLTL